MESKVQAKLAYCLSTILWVKFCVLIHMHGMHQLEVIGGITSIQTHCLACADKIDLCVDD